MGFNTSSIFIKVAFVCVLLATLLFIIGFATVSWMVYDQYHTYDTYDYGLWRVKHCGRRNSCSNYGTPTQDWMRATQAFECMGLISLAVAVIITVLFVFVDKMRKRSPLIAIIIFCFVAVACMIIGFIIFGTKLSSADVGWSMGVAIAGCILTFVAGVMCVIDLKK